MAVLDTSTRSLNAICFGLKPENEEWNHFISELQSTRKQAFNFLWLPASLISLTCAEMSLECGRMAQSLWYVQNRTGLHGGAYGRDLRLLEGKHDPVEQDIVDLTAVLDRCARFRAKVDAIKRLLDILKPSGESTREGDSGATGWVREKYDMNGQTVLGCIEHLEWLQQSASSQLQTVSATLVTTVFHRLTCPPNPDLSAHQPKG